jgi:ABC-type multidrug transport system ATPase subunit
METSEDVHALKDVFLEVEEGELLALLGHNGAGKTTLIGVLTGMLEADRGTAQIANMDINQSLDAIRKMMGVCPQFDILWN